jgi:hypothetical protein
MIGDHFRIISAIAESRTQEEVAVHMTEAEAAAG